ncbi:hypothetical protein BDZ91DRAFT_794801 [Kalaharituber pfeilii]|nr:hypothetical protein BDZ91DRAFT_794801 [Kalaharituber pfeilii]
MAAARDDSMEVTSPLGNQPFEELEDLVHGSAEADPEYESADAPPRSSSSSKGKAAAPRALTPAPEPVKKVAAAYKETQRMAEFRKTANKTVQKLKEATEQTSGEAQKALTDMANFTIQLKATADELKREFINQINPLIDNYNKVVMTLQALVDLAQSKKPSIAKHSGNTPPHLAPLAPPGSDLPPPPSPCSSGGGGSPPLGGYRPPPRDPSPPRREPTVPLRVNILTFDSRWDKVNDFFH